MAQASVVFSQKVLCFEHAPSQYQERAFSVTQRKVAKRNESTLNLPEKYNHFEFRGLKGAIGIQNFSKEVNITNLKNQFSFQYLNTVKKRPPYTCKITIFQQLNGGNWNRVFILLLTVCPYSVYRDIEQIDKIVPTKEESSLCFSVEDGLNSSFILRCEDVTYPTIFGGEGKRTEEIFQILQPQFAKDKKEERKRKANKKSSNDGNNGKRKRSDFVKKQNKCQKVNNDDFIKITEEDYLEFLKNYEKNNQDFDSILSIIYFDPSKDSSPHPAQTVHNTDVFSTVGNNQHDLITVNQKFLETNHNEVESEELPTDGQSFTSLLLNDDDQMLRKFFGWEYPDHESL